MRPDGATALYDAVAEALPSLQSGRHPKKALLVISDGNDTNSRIDLEALKDLIHRSEALVLTQSGSILNRRPNRSSVRRASSDSSADGRCRGRVPCQAAEPSPKSTDSGYPSADAAAAHDAAPRGAC